ncbi:MAG: ABC transporter permease [Bacteroidetes bacterium]|nr:ABC transporter permease [Bacteroidota bacterium]
MFASRFLIGVRMTGLELLRSRYILALVFAMPLIFYLMIYVTSAERDMPMLFGMVSDSREYLVNERDESLVFFGTGAIALVAAFIALKLTQRHHESSRRLVLCGYSTTEVLLSRIGTLLLSLIPLGCYVLLLLLCFFTPGSILPVTAGFVLAGFVYAALGALIGVLFRNEIEGVLAVLLIANIDAVWMQNPIYYTASEHREIIRVLPAYFPTQASMLGAFTDESVLAAAGASLLYGGILLLIALFIYWRRMRVV